MNTPDIIALCQLILSALVALIGGTLAIAAYLRVLKTTDENTRARKEEIGKDIEIRKNELKQAGDQLQQLMTSSGQQWEASIKRDKYAVAGLMILAICFLLISENKISKISNEIRGQKRGE